MKVVDINVLLYATMRGFPQHAACREFLEQALGGSEPLGLTWLVMMGFLRISTKPQLFERPLTMDEAIDLLEFWIAQPAATLVAPSERHTRVLRDLLGHVGTAGNLTSDAHLAAIAIEHGAAIVSCDRDFTRFPGLVCVDPTAA